MKTLYTLLKSDTFLLNLIPAIGIYLELSYIKLNTIETMSLSVLMICNTIIVMKMIIKQLNNDQI
jgi:hypothetical protein